MPFLLSLIYTIPLFYYRKYLRERWFNWSDLKRLKDKIEAVKPRTVLCVSHRPAFWVSNLKRRERMDFRLWGLLGEYGSTLGWKYLFWNEINGFLSPLGRGKLDYPFPVDLEFKTIDLPARRGYENLASRPGSKDCVLLVCGFWGQGPILRLLKQLLASDRGLRVHAVCGENGAAYEQTCRAFQHLPNVQIHGAVGSLLHLMEDAGCVITKPGISTILEAHAARRKLFLVKGIPIAENRYNAGFDRAHFGAEWFSMDRFRRWRAAPEG
jgi:UDP-N-acetylglucosamine:LPS N-acetylglucosamine transferase